MQQSVIKQLCYMTKTNTVHEQDSLCYYSVLFLYFSSQYLPMALEISREIVNFV